MDAVEPVYFDRTYYIAPRGKEYTKVYELLHAALAEGNKAGIATFVMPQKLSKAELYQRATDQEVAGRSKMSREELIDALALSGRRPQEERRLTGAPRRLTAPGPSSTATRLFSRHSPTDSSLRRVRSSAAVRYRSVDRFGRAPRASSVGRQSRSLREQA
ncbi:Ku protein [Streptomyces glomeratus]|uniref:Ku protein n=1 Tax=Streptomyces glomeratus TaxID=284452 RepID=UPI003557E43A